MNAARPITLDELEGGVKEWRETGLALEQLEPALA